MANNEPLVIERRVMGPERQRKVIIEHLPAPPPKPRDIILEKWLPKDATHQQQRQVYLQKGSSVPQQYHHHHQHQQQQSLYSHHSKHQHYSNHHQHQNQQYIYSKPIYEDFAEHGHNKQQRRDIYEKMEKQSQLNGSAAPKALKKSLRRSESNEIIFPQQKTYAPHSTIPTTTTSTTKAQSPHQKPSLDSYSSPQNVKTPKVAGYRVIRQIIPGPNSTQADIEKVLSRGSSRSSTHTNIITNTNSKSNNNNNNEILTKNTLHQTKHSFVMKGGVSPSYGTMIRDCKREQPIVSSASNSVYNSHSVMRQSPFRKTNNTDYGSMNRSNSIDKF